jgi:disulfide bond formation protein DsbB
MCLAQREWHWGILGVAFVSFLVLRRRPGDARWIALVLALAFLGSFAMAADHVAVEHHWITAQCETGPVGNLHFDLNAPLDVPHCDTPAWMMFGISMAGYNALISLAAALIGFALALAPERKP